MTKKQRAFAVLRGTACLVFWVISFPLVERFLQTLPGGSSGWRINGEWQPWSLFDLATVSGFLILMVVSFLWINVDEQESRTTYWNNTSSWMGSAEQSAPDLHRTYLALMIGGLCLGVGVFVAELIFSHAVGTPLLPIEEADRWWGVLLKRIMLGFFMTANLIVTFLPFRR